MEGGWCEKSVMGAWAKQTNHLLAVEETMCEVYNIRIAFVYFCLYFTFVDYVH